MKHVLFWPIFSLQPFFITTFHLQPFILTFLPTLTLQLNFISAYILLGKKWKLIRPSLITLKKQFSNINKSKIFKFCFEKLLRTLLKSLCVLVLETQQYPLRQNTLRRMHAFSKLSNFKVCINFKVS